MRSRQRGANYARRSPVRRWIESLIDWLVGLALGALMSGVGHDHAEDV